MDLSPELPAVSSASDAELTLICAAAAERGVAFCRVLGPSGRLAWAEAALELAWSAAAGESVQDECATALDEVEMDADDDEDDSSRPEFFVAQSTALIGNALAVSLRPSATKAELSVNALRSILSMLDFKMAGEKTVIVKYGEEPPPPGLLVQMEIDAERDFFGLLHHGVGGSGREVNLPDLVAQIQTSSREFAARLVVSIEEIVDHSNWEL